MYTSNVVGAVALLFILAMAILRIRMQYARGAHRRLRLTGVGAAYLAVLVVLLGSGWFLAPRFGGWHGRFRSRSRASRHFLPSTSCASRRTACCRPRARKYSKHLSRTYNDRVELLPAPSRAWHLR